LSGDCDFFLFLLLCALCVLCGENFLVLQLSRERNKRDVACALDRFAEPPLVARARARHAARQNFASILHEWLKHLDLLVVDKVHALDTRTGNLSSCGSTALAARARAARAATTRPPDRRPSRAASPPATGEFLRALASPSAGMPFGAVCTATGAPFARGALGAGVAAVFLVMLYIGSSDIVFPSLNSGELTPQSDRGFQCKSGARTIF